MRKYLLRSVRIASRSLFLKLATTLCNVNRKLPGGNSLIDSSPWIVRNSAVEHIDRVPKKRKCTVLL